MSRIGIHHGLPRQLAFGAISSFVIQVFWKILGLVSMALLARFLGVDGLGVYVFAFTIVGFVTTFGTDSFVWVIVQKLASYRGLQQWSLAKGLMRRTRQISISIAISLALCAAVGTWYLLEPGGNQLLLTLMVAFMMAPVITQIHLNSATLQGFGHVILAQLPNWVVWPCTFLALLVAFDLVPQIEMSAPVAMFAQVMAACITLIVGVLLLWPRIPPIIRIATPTYKTKEWMRASLPFLTIGMLHKVNAQADILLLGAIAGTEAVGIYRPATAIALAIMFGADSVGRTIRPTVAHRYATGNTNGFQRLSAYTTWVGFGVAFFGASIALLFGNLILSFFGPRFVEGTTALGILCVGRVISTTIGQPSVFLEMSGRQSITMRGNIWAAGTNTFLNLALIPYFGVNGAAIATVSSVIVFKFYNMIAVRRELSIDTTILSLNFRADSTTPQISNSAPGSR